MIMASCIDRRAVIRAALIEHPEWSNRRIAELTRLGRVTVSYHRTKLVAEGVIPDGPVIGRDGRCYSPNPPRNFSLVGRVALIRRLTRDVGDEAWKAADPRTRRALWLAADSLAEEAAKRIDLATGEIKLGAASSF